MQYVMISITVDWKKLFKIFCIDFHPHTGKIKVLEKETLKVFIKTKNLNTYSVYEIHA